MKYIFKEKKVFMKRFKGILAVGFAATMMFALTGCGKTTVNLDKYVTITTEGYDSMGVASYEFDSDAFEKDYSAKIKPSKNNKEISGIELLSGENSAELLLDFCVSEKLDKTSELSNGDVITLKWDCEDAMAEENFNSKLVYSDITYTVDNLEEVGKFNPFDYVEVSFSGIAPNGEVSITPNYDQPEMQYISFKADNESGLNVGDTVSVTASINGDVESFVEKFGSVLGKTEETYTVAGLSKYVKDISELSQDTYDKMDKQLQDDLTATFASWENEYLRGMDLIGTYTVSLKEGMTADTNNYIYFVYKITAENDESNGEFNYYWFGCYKDVCVNEDGTDSVDLSDYTIAESDSNVKFKIDEQTKYVYYGNTDLDALYNYLVVSKIDQYEYTQTVK